MPPETEQFEFLKRVYQNLAEDEPLEPGDPRYEPVYELPGCEDPVRQLERKIRFAVGESISFFSGFRGSGKTPELFRLREKLTALGYTVLYADALRYIKPHSTGLARRRLARLAADPAERDRHVDAARACWSQIGRSDLIAELDKEFGPGN